MFFSRYFVKSFVYFIFNECPEDCFMKAFWRTLYIHRSLNKLFQILTTEENFIRISMSPYMWIRTILGRRACGKFNHGARIVDIHHCYSTCVCLTTGDVIPMQTDDLCTVCLVWILSLLHNKIIYIKLFNIFFIWLGI